MDFALAESFAQEDIPLQGPDKDPLSKKAWLIQNSIVQGGKKFMFLQKRGSCKSCKKVRLYEERKTDRRVINNLPVEVLDIIVRFVPRVYDFDDVDHLDTAIPFARKDDESDSEAEDPEGEDEHRSKKPISSLAELRILTQFRLRLLSKKWAALTYQQNASIGLFYDRGFVCFTHGEKDATLILSKPKVPAGCAELKELTDETVAWIEQHSLLDHVTQLFVAMEISDWRSESVAAVLSKLTSSSVITQPCTLDLALEEIKDVEAVHSFVHHSDAPFQQQFPALSLRALTFDFTAYEAGLFQSTPEYYQAACRCLKHFLAAGASSLVELNLNLFFLKAAFEVQQPGYAGGDPLPEDWACESLRVLSLEFLPFETNYDYASEPKKAALFAFQGRLPKLFPRLQSLNIWRERSQFDFSVLAQMPSLKTLKLSVERLQQDSNIQPLPNIRTLSIDCEMPFELSPFVPNADALTFSAFKVNAFACLADEIYSAPSSSLFQGLSKLTIVGDRVRERPPFADLLGLLRALQSLPRLERLKIKASEYNAWSRDGDLSLLSVLPAGLKFLSLEHALVPSECVKFGRQWRINVVNPGDPNLRENIYKGWLRNLLHQISTIPALEKVHCFCVAPSFATIVGLAAKWNKGSEYALADLGLSCVDHVQCTENLQRIRVEDAFHSEDAVCFRFSVTPQAQFERHSLKKSKGDLAAMKKIVSVTFENAD